MQKALMVLLSLLLSITGTLHAQEKETASPEDRLFTPPPYSIGINYTIQLGKGNILRLDLANGYDLRSFKNIDSLLSVFLGDLQAFQDSLSDPLTVKHIDYLIDTSGKKKLRIRQYRPAATSFLLDGKEPALLRIEQDTIRILVVSSAPGRSSGLTVNGLRYDGFCFFVNHYSELQAVVNNGLNEEVRSIISRQLVKPNKYSHPFCYIVRDSIVHTHIHDGNQISIPLTVAVQNYKNYFAPSFALGLRLGLDRAHDEYKLGASWEPLFFSPRMQKDDYKPTATILSSSPMNTIVKTEGSSLISTAPFHSATSFGTREAISNNLLSASPPAPAKSALSGSNPASISTVFSKA